MYERVPLNGAINNAPKWAVGTELIAKFEFKGSSPEDLSFGKNDVLAVTGLTKVCLHPLLVFGLF